MKIIHVIFFGVLILLISCVSDSQTKRIMIDGQTKVVDQKAAKIPSYKIPFDAVLIRTIANDHDFMWVNKGIHPDGMEYDVSTGKNYNKLKEPKWYKKEVYKIISNQLETDLKDIFENVKIFDHMKDVFNFTLIIQPIIRSAGYTCDFKSKNQETFMELTLKIFSSDKKLLDEITSTVNMNSKTTGWSDYPRPMLSSVPGIISKEILAKLSKTEGVLKYVKAYRETLLAEKQKKELPSNLAVAVHFFDEHSFSPNNIIDAGEDSKIIVDLKNNGKGTAFGVKLKTFSDNNNIQYSKELKVGDILPGQSKKVIISVSANSELSTEIASFKIKASEKRGYDSKTYNLNIPVARLQRPDLQISNYKINDGKTGLASGNGNGIPENGETIELIPFIKNNGVGRAIKVNLAIDSINLGIELIKKSTEIDEILPGQTVTGKLVFTLPRTYSGGNLKINVVASDVRGASDDNRVVTLNTQSNRPILAYSYKIIDGNGNNVMENGEEGFIEITPSNKGNMEARDISIKLFSLDLSITKDSDEIHRIAAGSEYTPLRFPFKVSRTLEKDSIDIQLSFNQKDFSGLTDNIHIPIKLVIPEFVISYQIRDPNNNGAIEKGETIDLLIRVKNTGGLDAGDVKLKVEFDKDGVVYSGPKIVEVGRIAAGQTSNSQTFTFNVTRRTAPGSLPLNIIVSQNDFSPKNLSLALNIVKEKAQIINVAGQKKPEYIAPIASANSNNPPMVFIAGHQDQKRVASTFEIISGLAGDDKGISNIEVRLNGKRFDTARDISVTAPGTGQRQRNFNFRIPLKIGKNIIEVTALDIENLSSSKSLTIYREAEKGELYVAVIGINNYQHVPSLNYARNDAKAFADYMVSNMGVDSDHLFELYDTQATVTAMRSLLGTKLRRIAKRPEDTVYIFFAGHGAPEKDSQSEDGDGITKYILAHDSHPDDLYTTALPMNEIARIFSRIKAQRVVFISDSCYSGGSGGRTVLAQGWRSNISNAFYDRIVRAGKGRIILTSSNAQEVSQESDELGHGYFTYYLIEGLKGKADISKDGEIDLDEIYRYLNKMVPDATNGSQHPMKKGEAEGRVIIGRVK